MKKNLVLLGLFPLFGVAVSASATLISVDAVTGGSVPYSGDFAGDLPGQTGAWNSWTLNAAADTLNNLVNGAGGVTGISLLIGASYHTQQGFSGTPYNPGIVLASQQGAQTGDGPERAWVTGPTGSDTFEFTGLTANASYTLQIYTTADPHMTITVNGNATLNPGQIFNTTTTADGSGDINGSWSESVTNNYAEISGFQLQSNASSPIPEPASMALLGLGGLALLRRSRHRLV